MLSLCHNVSCSQKIWSGTTLNEEIKNEHMERNTVFLNYQCPIHLSSGLGRSGAMFFCVCVMFCSLFQVRTGMQLSSVDCALCV